LGGDLLAERLQHRFHLGEHFLFRSRFHGLEAQGVQFEPARPERPIV